VLRPFAAVAWAPAVQQVRAGLTLEGPLQFNLTFDHTASATAPRAYGVLLQVDTLF